MPFDSDPLIPVLAQTEAGTSEALRAAAQALLAEVLPQLGFDQGDLTMFVMDMPNVPPQYAPVVIAQAAQARNSAKTDRTIGVCHLVENKTESRLSAINSMMPTGAAWAYLKDQEHAILNEADYKAAKMTLLQVPEHGELELDEATQSAGYFSTDFNYVGPDRATVLVEIGGFKVKVMYFFRLMSDVPGSGAQGTPYDDKTLCPKGRVWKISLSNPNDPTGQLSTFNNPNQLTCHEGQTPLHGPEYGNALPVFPGRAPASDNDSWR